MHYGGKMRYKCLSIAGFDGSGGAGIQADLKTFSALGCYGMTILTALPVQNTCGVKKCYNLPVSAIEEQLETIFEDIAPDSIKIGMLFSADIIEVIARFLKENAKSIPIVLDPVMIAKSGDRLLLEDAILALKEKMFPLSTIVTPNLPEAFTLVGESDCMETTAQKLIKLGSKSILLKGGHLPSAESNDFFLDNKGHRLWLKHKRIDSKNTHGTGCTLSAAIAANLAKGDDLISSCQKAKEYLFGAILHSQNNSVGKGHGPVHHFFNLWDKI